MERVNVPAAPPQTVRRVHCPSATGVKVVSWDVDGTLFSYAELTRALIRLAPRKLRAGGWAEIRKDIRDVWKFHWLVERQRRQPGSRVIESELEPFSSASDKEREALDLALRQIGPPENVVQLLETLAAAGIRQVALSDFECRYKLRALGLERYFDMSYSCRSLGFWKPSPVPLQHIQRIYGIRPHEHLHIGDRLDADQEACARNGCRSARPTLCMSSLRAIIRT